MLSLAIMTVDVGVADDAAVAVAVGPHSNHPMKMSHPHPVPPAAAAPPTAAAPPLPINAADDQNRLNSYVTKFHIIDLQLIHRIGLSWMKKRSHRRLMHTSGDFGWM